MIDMHTLQAGLVYHGAEYVRLARWLPTDVVNVISVSLGDDTVHGAVWCSFREIAEGLEQLRYRCCPVKYLASVVHTLERCPTHLCTHTYVLAQYEIVRFSKPYHVFEVIEGVAVERCVSIDAKYLFTGRERCVVVK